MTQMHVSDDTYPPIGILLRELRAVRRMSQIDLALDCGMSPRHLGFVEKGRARPSRDAIARLADALGVSLRERNAMLLAAGFAPQHPDMGLASPGLSRMREAVDLILRHQNPFPAFVLNRTFDILDANQGAAHVGRFITGGREPRHGNLLHQVFDPEDLRPVIDNWEVVAAWFLRRLHDEIVAAPGNAVARGLLDEILAYPDVPPAWRRPAYAADAEPVLTIDFKSPAGPLRFFETITTFAAPLSVTLDDLRIDCAFPADDRTREVCEALAAGESP